MYSKTLSVFGHLINFMNISTTDLANAVHVDSSLVSKWKSGSRKISERSVYFDDIIQYVLDSDSAYDYINLKNVLGSLFPGYTLDTEEDLKLLLRQSFCGKKASHALKDQELMTIEGNAIPTFSFVDLSGKREALEKLLDYAEQMAIPTQLTFMDATNFDWMADDPEFTGQFIRRLQRLLRKNFKCRFIVHYDVSFGTFKIFFSMCSILIFQSNVEWYYLPYYNSPVFNISISLLGHALSTFSFSSNMQNVSTTLFTDHALVLKHQSMAEDILKQCSALFRKCALSDFPKIFNELGQYRIRGIFYNFLSSPTFIAVNPKLLTEILKYNGISEEVIRHCLASNAEIRAITQDYFFSVSDTQRPIIFFFRLDEMMRRLTDRAFVSRSLSLFCGKKVIVPPQHYARQLRYMANALIKYPNFNIILSTQEDKTDVPAIDCWYMQHTWILQMDQNGYRLCNDPGIVNTLSDSIAKYIKNIPETRKNKESVRYYLLDLAEKLKTSDI